MSEARGPLKGIRTFFRTDWNIVRARRLIKRGFKAAPRGTARYLGNKIPLTQWVGSYKVRWAPLDLLSGATVGVVLVLQAVNLSQPFPGGITIDQTLLASWLPGFLYALTGTSKSIDSLTFLVLGLGTRQVMLTLHPDISVGPTTTSTILTLPIVAGFSAGAQIPPQVVLPALTLAVGVWFLLFGLLGLGFLFDLIPVFFCIALVTALAIVGLTLQVPILLGLLGVAPNFMTIIPDTIGNLGNVSLRTVAISVSALVILGVLRAVHGRWGRESTARGTAAQLGVAAAGLLVIVIFTGVSSVFLHALPLQQQLAPFIPPVMMGAPGGAGGGIPPQAALGAGIPPQGALGGIPPQAAMGGIPPQAGIPPQGSLGGAPPQPEVGGTAPQATLGAGIPSQTTVSSILPQATGGGIDPQAAAGGISPQAAPIGNATLLSPMSRSNFTTGSLALVDPMLRRRAAVVAKRQLPVPSQGPPPAFPGNLSAAPASTQLTASGPPLPPVPKLPFWSAFPPFNTMIPSARPPVFQLAQGLFLPSLAIFMAINVEHLVVARFFAYQQDYAISKSQEMFSLGVINVANAFFGGVPVGGGDMTRSSVLGFAGARSPLNQLFASSTVLVAMMPASGALRFLPQAALAAITFMAILDQQPSQTALNVYFKMSFADFLAFFIILNGAIAAPPGIGAMAAILVGILYMIFYTIFRGMFARPKIVRAPDLEASPATRDSWPESYISFEKRAIPASTLVVATDVDLVWTNAERMYRHIVDAAFVYNTGPAIEPLGRPELPWNVQERKYIRSARRRHERRHKQTLAAAAAAADDDGTAGAAFRQRLRVVVLDFSKVAFIDTSGLLSLELVKKRLRHWAGDDVEFRFVGLNKHLVRRFQRAKWPIVNPLDEPEEQDAAAAPEGGDKITKKDLMFDNLDQALRYVSQDVEVDVIFEKGWRDSVGSSSLPEQDNRPGTAI